MTPAVRGTKSTRLMCCNGHVPCRLFLSRDQSSPTGSEASSGWPARFSAKPGSLDTGAISYYSSSSPLFRCIRRLYLVEPAKSNLEGMSNVQRGTVDKLSAASLPSFPRRPVRRTNLALGFQSSVGKKCQSHPEPVRTMEGGRESRLFNGSSGRSRMMTKQNPYRRSSRGTTIVVG